MATPVSDTQSMDSAYITMRYPSWDNRVIYFKGLQKEVTTLLWSLENTLWSMELGDEDGFTWGVSVDIEYNKMNTGYLFSKTLTPAVEELINDFHNKIINKII